MKKYLIASIAVAGALFFTGCGSQSSCGCDNGGVTKLHIEGADDPEKALQLFYRNLRTGDLAIARALAEDGQKSLYLRWANAYLKDIDKLALRTKLLKKDGNAAYVLIYYTNDRKHEPYPTLVEMYYDQGVWKFNKQLDYYRGKEKDF